MSEVIVLDYSCGFDWVPNNDTGEIWINNEQKKMIDLGFDSRVRVIDIPEDVRSLNDVYAVTEWLEENIEMM